MIRAKHSGNAGDVIYALPALQTLCRQRKTQAHLLLNLYQPNILYPGATHPLGKVRLDETMLKRLKPLLNYQSYISDVSEYDTHPVDLDLDAFRELPLNPTCGSIPRWYLGLAQVSCDLSQPWLEARRRKEFARHIVISRSSRYRNPNLDYRFLNMYPNILFVGLEEEFLEMRSTLPKLGFYAVNDFLELADIVKSCLLFIGNQSFTYALAEALKVPRVLEPCLFAGNVIPTGDHAYDAYTQAMFEQIVCQTAANR